MPPSIKKVRRNIIYVFVSQLFIKPLGFLYVFVIARFLPVQDYGVYNLMFGSILLFNFLTNFGLGCSLQRFLPEYCELKQNTRVLRTIIWSHLLRAITCIAVFCAAFALYDIWAPRFGVDLYRQEFAIFCISTFLLFQVEYFEIEFNALFHQPSVAKIQLWYNFIKVALVCVAVNYGMGLAAIFSAEGAAYFSALLAFTYVYISRIAGPLNSYKNSSPRNLEFSRIGRFSLISALIVPGTILYSQSMDFFVIAAMANTYELGLYALASRANSMLMGILPQNVLQSVIRPFFYRRYYSVREDVRQQELEKMFKTLVTFNAAFVFPIMIFTTIYASSLVRHVFGDKYLGSSSFLMVFAFFNLFTFLELACDLVLQAVEQIQGRLYVQIFAVYNVVAAIILMPHFGPMGVACATGTAVMFRALLYYYMARIYVGISVPWRSIIQICFNSLCFAAILVLFCWLRHGILWMVLAGVTAGTVYAIQTYVFTFSSTEDKALIHDILGRRSFNV